MDMSDTDKIKSLVKEADFYRSQGLLEQAKYKYSEAIKLVRKSETINKKESLIDTLNKRIKSVTDSLEEIEKATDLPEFSLFLKIKMLRPLREQSLLRNSGNMKRHSQNFKG